MSPQAARMIFVADSGCSGKGLFAEVSLAPGSRIVQYIGEMIGKEESQKRRLAGNAYIFHLDFERSLDGSALSNQARYVNHSCRPNCRIEIDNGQIWLVADRQLEAGEELFFNYGFDAGNYQDFPCSCGSSDCCGYMVDRSYWGELPRAWRRFSLIHRETAGKAEVWVESLAYQAEGELSLRGDRPVLEALRRQLPSRCSAPALALALSHPEFVDYQIEEIF